VVSITICNYTRLTVFTLPLLCFILLLINFKLQTYVVFETYGFYRDTKRKTHQPKL